MQFSTSFRNRAEAGRLLAGKLRAYAHRPEVLVLGLPRGGVPVAFEVARVLGVPLDVLVVRKLGAPGQEELAMGAIASGGVRVLNRDVIDSLRVSEDEIDAVARRELQELARREEAFRPGRPPLDVAGRTVILVDDGIATGATMRAGVAALRAMRARRIVVATPTAAASSVEEIRLDADDVVCVMTPLKFFAVGQWYEDFTQTTDEEVRVLLERSPPSAAAPPA